MKKACIFLLAAVLLAAGILSGCKKKNILFIRVMADTEVSAAMEALMEEYQAAHKNVQMEAVYDESRTLFERIKDLGEECDVFLTDSQDDMDILSVKRLLIDGTRKNLLTQDTEEGRQVYLVAKVENRDTDIEQSEAVSDFIEYLTTDGAMEIFAQYGFKKYTE